MPNSTELYQPLYLRMYLYRKIGRPLLRWTFTCMETQSTKQHGQAHTTWHGMRHLLQRANPPNMLATCVSNPVQSR